MFMTGSFSTIFMVFMLVNCCDRNTRKRKKKDIAHVIAAERSRICQFEKKYGKKCSHEFGYEE